MNYSHIYSLARETALYLRSFPSQNESSRRYIETLGFAKDLEMVNEQILYGQWPGESMVRALRFAPYVLGHQCEPQLRPLYEVACAAFGSVRWTEFYEEDDWSRSFLPNFANGEGIGQDGRLYSGDVILGLFILGTNTLYPPHAHPAKEFYLILSGKADWQIGVNTPYKMQEPGNIMIHLRNESHSIRTYNEPLFCVYGWRGEIDAKTWYRNNMADNSEIVKYPRIKKS